ncbi:MAG: exonuclease [Phascolarctobacterium sp.]|nr:MAG: exonuclease [Phascolarctobacterium sp.]
MIVFRSCAAVEKEIEWYDGFSTLHSEHTEAEALIDDLVQSITDKVLHHYKYVGEYEILMCFSDPKENFRKKLLPTYKANRANKRKPLGYYEVVKWVHENYKTYLKPSLEADDCVGILMTMKGANAVAISGDKDFKSIPGKFYNFIQDEFMEVSKEEADYNHLYQTLIGDTADNYKGCPGIGSVTAHKLLHDAPNWGTVVEAFEKKGLTEDDALLQARVARILRASDYDFKKKEPIMWTPVRTETTVTDK